MNAALSNDRGPSGTKERSTLETHGPVLSILLAMLVPAIGSLMIDFDDRTLFWASYSTIIGGSLLAVIVSGVWLVSFREKATKAAVLTDVIGGALGMVCLSVVIAWSVYFAFFYVPR